jgi:hypothetical protein
MGMEGNGAAGREKITTMRKHSASLGIELLTTQKTN